MEIARKCTKKMQNVQRRASGRQKSQRHGRNVPHGAKNGHPHAKSHRRMRRNGKLAYLRVPKSSRNIMDTIERIARRNRLRAEEVIRDSRLAEIWRSVGAEVRQVGSLRSGLLMKHRDIDFHIYSSPLRLEESFTAMAQLAADPAVGRIECRNLLATDEACVEWHATYRDRDGDEWQLDMIHIVRGSRYDGYFERVADRRADTRDAARHPATQIRHARRREDRRHRILRGRATRRRAHLRRLRRVAAYTPAHGHRRVDALTGPYSRRPAQAPPYRSAHGILSSFLRAV